jgi:hypothetical protein
VEEKERDAGKDQQHDRHEYLESPQVFHRTSSGFTISAVWR